MFYSPTQGVINLTINDTEDTGTINCTIINILGESVEQIHFESNSTHNYLIEAGHLPTGVYIIHLSRDDLNIGQSKIIIE